MFGTGDGHTVGYEYLCPSLCKSYIVGRCSQCHSTAHTAPVRQSQQRWKADEQLKTRFVDFHNTVSTVAN